VKLLLDENLPVDLRLFLTGHEAITVAYMGWKGLTNGALLARAAASGFDAVITKDSGIPYEQNTASLPLSIVVIRSASNSLDDIRPLVAGILQALERMPARTIVRVGDPADR